MNNLPLQPLVWQNTSNSDLYAEGANYHYDVAGNKGSYFVRYLSKDFEASMKRATGFATIDEAKTWCWNHYNEKMQPYVKQDSITDIANWFKAAKPEPTDKDRSCQIGVHYEEISEMADVLRDGMVWDECITTQAQYKACSAYHVERTETLSRDEKVELLDSLCDQIVTATGVAYMMGFDIEGALKEVIRSNNSKFEDGKPLFNEQGKIMKGRDYSKPDLTPFVKQGE